MYVTVPPLILRVLEASCWRLAAFLGRLDLLLGRWGAEVRTAQLWAIDRAFAAFEATFPPTLDPSVPAQPLPADRSPIALPDAPPDAATDLLSPAPFLSLEGRDPPVLH